MNAAFSATILLHDPHADVYSPTCPSAEKLLSAARAILDLIYKICGTTFDLIFLDHASSMCWFMAGFVLVRFLRVKTDEGKEEEVAQMTQELGVVK